MAENTKLLSAEPFVSNDISLGGFRNNSRNDYGLLLLPYRFFRSSELNCELSGVSAISYIAR